MRAGSAAGPARAAFRPHRRPPIALVAGALFVVGLVLLPLVYLAVRATGDGAAWSVLTRPGTLETIAKTVALVLGVVAASVVIGVPLAWLLTRTDLPGRRIWAVAATVPLVIPSYVAALALLGAFGPKGLLQQALAVPFEIDRVPEIYGYPGALAALVLSTYPYVFLLTAAALLTLDPSLEEASRGLGRSPFVTFFRVTLPVLRPSIATGAILVALYTLSDFGAVALMQYDSLTRVIYLQYRALFERTPAAVLALVLVVMTAAILVLEARSRRGRRYHSLGPGTARQPRIVRLGAWRWPALGFCALVVGLFLAMPLAVLGYWLERALSLGQELSFAWQPLLNTVWVAGAAAGVATVAAFPVALLACRYPRRWTAGLERLTFTSNALPGIVIALSLVFFGARYGGALYQTLGLLLIAYVVRFLPESLAGTSSALASVNPRLEEAARGLERSRLKVLALVTFPLARSGMLAGAALVALSTMKELPATLLLRPIGFETLATEIWTFASLGSYSRASLPALLLVAVAAPFVYLLRPGRGEPRPPG